MKHKGYYARGKCQDTEYDELERKEYLLDAIYA